MFKRIGIDYKSIEGGIKITACRARYGDVIWVPSSIIGFETVKIDDGAFKSEKNKDLKKVFLPKTLKHIGKNIFEDCESLGEIFFEGDETEWDKIEKETNFSEYKLIFGAKYPPLPKKKKKVKEKVVKSK